MSKFTEFTSKIGDFLQEVGTAISEEKKNQVPVVSDGIDVLTQSKLAELKWLPASQLAVIYQYGKRKTKIDDDPRAYGELKWFSAAQLKAIFGEEENEE